MVINSDIKVAYRGDGQTTVFPFSFPYFDKDYICVRILDEETGESTTLTSDYYVDTQANTVHYPGYAPGQEPPQAEQPPILPATSTLTIYRSSEISQLIELGQKYPLPVIESALDKITHILQEHDENIQRSIKVDITSTDDPQSYFDEIIETAKLGLIKAGEAIAAAENAAASEANAAASETSAANSATAALASQQAAALSETHAATSETNAAASETTAVASANSATASQQAAALSAESASASKLSAESSAGTAVANAAISTSAAQTAQNAATTCSEVLPQVLGAASNVATKASAAAASATQAALSANAAETASQTAVNAADDAQDAADDATAAANAAAVSAGAAATSATQAESANTEAKYYAKITMDKIAESAVGYPSQSGTLTYTGQVQTPTWDVFYEPQKLTITGDTSATNAGTYTITMTPKPTYYWWDDDTTTAKTQTWTIGRATVTDIPSQSGVVVYDGTEQTPTWADYDPAKLTIGGDTAGTNAGTYTATFTPTANYKWADGTTTAKSVTWEISAATVTIPTVTDTSKTYNGGSQAPTVTGLDTQTVEVVDDATAINAGSYMITFRLKNASLVWSDETTSDKSFAWTIGPKSVTAPTVTGTSFTYDGTSQGPTIGSYDTDAILVSGTTEAVGAGNYSVIFSLVSATNYKWSDETTEPKSVAWAINPATVAVPALSNKSKTYNGSAQSPTVSPYDSNLVEVTGTTTATNAGSYTVTFHLLNPNVTWADETTADKTDTWEIAQKAVEIPTVTDSSKTYNAALQSPTISAFSASEIIQGGTTSAVNAGTYTISFALTSANYVWSDTTTVEKTVSWSIAKAAGSLSLSKTSVSLNTSTTSSTVTVTRAGDGAITAVSSNTSYATVSVSGNVVTITGVATGSATVTISVGEGTNYFAPTSQTVSVNVQFIPSVLNDATWAQIQQVAQSGQADNYWDVGDQKEVVLNGTIYGGGTSNYTLSQYHWNCFIIGFNHNAEIEGNKTIHFQFGRDVSNRRTCMVRPGESYNYYRNVFSIHYDNTAIAWSDCDMRKKTISYFRGCLPTELRNVLKTITKYTRDGFGSTNVTGSQDSVFLLSTQELFGGSAENQKQYAYYAAGNSKIMYDDRSAALNAYNWWTRTPSDSNSGGTRNYSMVNGNGDSRVCALRESQGFAPGFCVG